MPAGDGEPLHRDGTSVIGIAHRECLLENGLHDVIAESFALKLISLAAQHIAFPSGALGTLAPADLDRSATRLAGLSKSRHATAIPESVARYKTRQSHNAHKKLRQFPPPPGANTWP